MCKDTDAYKDIIDRDYPFELHHQRMSMTDRAAQFSSFKALSGFENEIDEAARLTERQIVPGESESEEIDRKLRLIKEKTEACEQPLINIVYFRPDDKKDGGKYVSISEQIKKIDDIYGNIHTVSGVIIPIRDIYRLDGEIFDTDL